MAEQDLTCRMCLKQFAKYTCPRCNVRYCSVACYKNEKHMQCSELFYRDCFMEALKNERGSSGDKFRMMTLLQRMREEEEDVNDIVADLKERIAHIDLENDPDALWEALTTEEREEFQSAVQDGRIAETFKLWKPWWSSGEDMKNRQKIEVLESHQQIKREEGDSDDQHCNSSKSSIPTAMRNIPPVGEVLKSKTPSPNLMYDLIDVLYAYAYMMRFYNGSAEECVEQASESLLKLSSVLRDNVSFGSVEAVLHSCLKQVQEAQDLHNSNLFSLDVFLDVVSLIGGSKLKHGTFVECSLSDIYRLLRKGRSKVDAHANTDKRLSKSMWLAKKKVYFLLSWVTSAATSLEQLVPAIQGLYREILATHMQHQEDKKSLEKAWGGTKPSQRKTLVEEI